jgi:hypothetical protein
MDARDLISRITFEGRFDMTQEVFVMSEDMEYLIPFDVFTSEGRIIIKPNRNRNMLQIKLVD